MSSPPPPFDPEKIVHVPTHGTGAFTRSSRSLSMEELVEGRRIAALVVQQCGEIYRPIFEKLDKAVVKRESDDDRLFMVLNTQAPINRVPRRKRQTRLEEMDEQSLKAHHADNRETHHPHRQDDPSYAP